MREMGWTYDELLAQPDDIVWTLSTVLHLEGAKMERERIENERRNR